MPEFVPQAPDVPAFDYDPRTRVVFGAGTLDRLGEFARGLGGNRVLLVTDKGLKRAGHEHRAIDILQSAGLPVVVHDDVHSNPTTEDVENGTRFARQHGIDLIIGLGGGSSMDCAKGINFLLTNGGRMEDYWGADKATRPMLPMIAVPTTAGTGSEAQSYAIIGDPRTHMKMACGDKKAAPRVAVLDPELTVTMPLPVTAATGIDAITHAVESYVCTRRNPVSQLYSRQAWELLSQAFPSVMADGRNVAARGAMLLGSHLAGAAIENSMLGAAHAMANPLTAHFGVTHGHAVGVMLPHVIRFNADAAAGLYSDLASDVGLCAPGTADGALRLAEFVFALVGQSGAPTDLAACGVEAGLIPQMAREATTQWTGRFNPRPVEASQFEELYRCALQNGRA
jgi:alcohol dehydrogenase